MTLLALVILIGLLVTIVRTKLGGYQLAPPELRLTLLAVSALLFQMIALRYGTDTQAAITLVTSQAALLIFAWCNRRAAGLWLLLIGLGLNLLVIVANGGLMPISPETVARLFPTTHAEFELFDRLGNGKDILLPVAQTRLWILSDRFFVSFPTRVAFSLGDILIAAGAFRLLWHMSSHATQEEKQEEMIFSEIEPTRATNVA